MISPNMKSAKENPDMVETYLQTESDLGRIFGPFDEKPFPTFRCNPIGIVPKKNPGKFRTIMNLSFPPGSSVNDYISKEDFSLSYVTVDKAIDFILQLGRGCFLSKVDIADAFRIVPVSRRQWHLLGIFWNNKYYVDTRLSMGGRSSPYIFDRLSIALEWICKHNYELKYLCHLLDDFFTAEATEEKGNALSIILNIFCYLGIPIAPAKVEGPCTTIEFLGITLDSTLLEARLSPEKIEALIEKLTHFIHRQKVSKQELLSIIGSLSFACKVVTPGRSFLSRLITLSCTVRENHFKVYLNKHVKEDMRLWIEFLKGWNGKSFFLSRNPTQSIELQFYTDAASETGYGGYFRGAWFAAEWKRHQRQPMWSMPCQELFPILVAATVWGSRWRNLRIQVFCDNESTVNMLNKGYTNKEPAATMLRDVMFVSMRSNFSLKARHIPGIDNSLADSLSRLQLDRFRRLAPDAEALMTSIPDNLACFGL